MIRRSGGHQASIGWDAAQGPLVATYQTRISDYGDMVRAGGDAGLSAYGELYGKVQRKLFAAIAAGQSGVLLKSEYIKKHGIPARMFNAVRVSLEGKVSSVREQQKRRVDGLQRRTARGSGRLRSCGHGGRNSTGGRQEVPLADRVGASWRGRSVGRMGVSGLVAAVRPEMAGRAIVPGRH